MPRSLTLNETPCLASGAFERLLEPADPVLDVLGIRDGRVGDGERRLGHLRRSRGRR